MYKKICFKKLKLVYKLFNKFLNTNYDQYFPILIDIGCQKSLNFMFF